MGRHDNEPEDNDYDSWVSQDWTDVPVVVES